MGLWRGLRYYWWFLVGFLEISVFWVQLLSLAGVKPESEVFNFSPSPTGFPCENQAVILWLHFKYAKDNLHTSFWRGSPDWKKNIESNGTSFISSQHCLWVILGTISLPSTAAGRSRPFKVIAPHGISWRTVHRCDRGKNSVSRCPCFIQIKSKPESVAALSSLLPFL